MADLEKFVFIVTGGMIGETLDFSPMARAWMVNLVNKWREKPEFVLPARVNFVHFDFETSKVSVYEHAFPLKGTKEPSLKDSDWKELADPRTEFKDIDMSTLLTRLRRYQSQTSTVPFVRHRLGRFWTAVFSLMPL